MKEMSPEASQLVNAGRQAFRPTEADRARLMAAVTGSATLSSAGIASASRARRSFGKMLGMTPAAAVLALALPVAAAGAFWLSESPEVEKPTLPVSQPSVIVAPRVTETPLRVKPQATEPPSEPNTPASTKSSGASVGESSRTGNEIRAEVALLSKAQAALSRGRPQEALEAIAEHARRFPRGALAEERSATRVRTLCALGRTQEAATELKRVQRLNPSSAYLARAQESCGLF
jgi:tetratricopeptide (TPR) repeat protein